MSGFSEDTWQRIKFLAARLQAIKNLLDAFNIELKGQPFAEDLQPIKNQLQDDFEKSLDELLKLIDNNDNDRNNSDNSEVNNH